MTGNLRMVSSPVREFENGWKDYGRVCLDASDPQFPIGIPTGEIDEEDNDMICFYSVEDAMEIWKQLGNAMEDFDKIGPQQNHKEVTPIDQPREAT